jgi:cytochrome c
MHEPHGRLTPEATFEAAMKPGVLTMGTAAVGFAAMFAVATTATAQAPGSKRGELLFLQCRACHSLTAAAEGKIGPPLQGFLGRGAAAVPGFQYSPALAGSALTWDEPTLDRWLAQPSAVVPGTTMVFAGMAMPEDRQQLIAYLKRVTSAR